MKVVVGHKETMEITPDVLRAASESVALLKSYVGVFQYFAGYAKFEGEAPEDDPKLIPPIMGVIDMLDRELVDRSTLPTSAIWNALHKRFITIEPLLRHLSNWSGDVPLHRFEKQARLGKFFLLAKDMDRDEFYAEADSMYSELKGELREFEIAIDAIYRERMRQQACSSGTSADGLDGNQRSGEPETIRDAKVPEKWMKVFRASEQAAITGLPVVDANTSMTSSMVQLSQTSRARPGYLELIVDHRLRTISRKGHEHKPPVDLFRRPAQWSAFMTLLKAEGNAEKADWSDYLNQFEKSGRRTVIDKLRGELTGFGLTISKNRYALIENVTGK